MPTAAPPRSRSGAVLERHWIAAESALARLDEALKADPVLRGYWYHDTMRREASAMAWLAGEPTGPDQLARALIDHAARGEAAQCHLALGMVLTDAAPATPNLDWLQQLARRASSHTSGQAPDSRRFSLEQERSLNTLLHPLWRDPKQEAHLSLVDVATLYRALHTHPSSLDPAATPPLRDPPGRRSPRTAQELAIIEHVYPHRAANSILAQLLLPVLARNFRRLHHPCLGIAQILAKRSGAALAAIAAGDETWVPFFLEAAAAAARGLHHRLGVLQLVAQRWQSAIGRRRADSLLPEALDLIFEHGAASSTLFAERFRISTPAALKLIDVLTRAHVIRAVSAASTYRKYLATDLL